MDTTLLDIEQSTKKFAEAYAELSDFVTELNDAVEAVKRARLKIIKAAVEKAAHRRATLETLIDGNRHLFIKPRTIIMHGIKVGLRKGAGGIEFDDPDKVVELIEKYFPDDIDLLIHIEKTPNKEALANRPAADLKRLGVEVKDTTDQVVIKPTDTEVDKIVTALLKDATEQEAA
jgi:hypothetical protein